MGALPKEEQTFTYADYKEWELKKGERFELIYGEAYAMAGPNTRHQIILSYIFNKFYNFLEGKPCTVFPAPYDVRLFYEGDDYDDTIVQPDILVICDKNKISTEGCRGAPDLVIEILSPSNTAIEMQQKLSLYRSAGVREYWVVDPENKKIQAYHFSKNKIFSYIYSGTDTIPVEIFPELKIQLEQVFAE
jgi:Uma2 family endonuclease